MKRAICWLLGHDWAVTYCVTFDVPESEILVHDTIRIHHVGRRGVVCDQHCLRCDTAALVVQ